MDSVRVDIWLWAARFFKTRSQAKRACELGRIRVNGQAAKPARELRIGDRLRTQILERFSGHGSAPESGFLTNARHQQLVRDSIAALDDAARSTREHVPHEMVLLDLYNALRALDTITGQTTADDILNLIFSSFCIGK